MYNICEHFYRSYFFTMVQDNNNNDDNNYFYCDYFRMEVIYLFYNDLNF